jgi:hypothetical protein
MVIDSCERKRSLFEEGGIAVNVVDEVKKCIWKFLEKNKSFRQEFISVSI